MSDVERPNPFRLWFADFPNIVFDPRVVFIEQSISGLFAITVDARTADDNISFDNLIDRGAALSLVGGSFSGSRLWTGVCAQVIHVAAHPGALSDYRIHLLPELWRLDLRRNTRIFQNRSIPEIVVEVLNDWGIVPARRGNDLSDLKKFPKFEYRVQYEETDFSFISRLLEEAGIAYYFHFDNRLEGAGRDRTTLVLDHKPEKAAEASEGESGDGKEREGSDKSVRVIRYLGHHDNLHERGWTFDAAFNATFRRTLATGSVTMVDHEMRRELGARVQGAAEVEGTEQKYETFEYGPGRLHTNDPKAGDMFDPELARTSAAVRLRGLRAETLVAEFITNAIEISPGMVVRLGDGHDDPERTELRQNLLVTRTKFFAQPDGRFYVSCTAVPADGEWRPPQKTKRPRIEGLQSALVVGPAREVDEEIHVDELGRVKLQFHWDRQHEYGEPLGNDAEGKPRPPLATRWVRFGTLWAGSGYGFVALPRPGHEVLVTFLNGDPDEPIIVGAVHNQHNPSPYQPLPDMQRRTGIRTNSSAGGGGFNEMFFDDAKGKERIHFQSEKDRATLVKGAETHNVGGGRTTSIGRDDIMHVGKQWELSVGTKKNGFEAFADNRLYIQVNGGAGAQFELKGTELSGIAMTDIHFHAGADIHLSANGLIDIDSNFPAQKVSINEPGRAPDEVEDIPELVHNAAAPQRGAAIGPGKKGVGGGGMPKPIGAIAADVRFDPPEEEREEKEEEDEEDEEDEEGDGHDHSGTRELRRGDPDFAQQAITSGLGGGQIDPQAVSRDIDARYGEYMSPDVRNRNPVIASMSPENYARARAAAGVSADTAAFYALPSARLPDGAIILQQGASPDIVYHEMLHARTSPAFMQWASTPRNTAFEEATTQYFTQRSMADTGLTPNTTVYDRGAARIAALNLPEGVLERAYFGGDTAGLAAAIQQRTGRPATAFFNELAGLERTRPRRGP